MGRRGPQAKQVTTGDVAAKLDSPADLSPAALLVWRAYVPPLKRRGYLLELDAAVLAAFCEYAAQWRAYTTTLSTLTPGSQEHARLSRVANDSHSHMQKAIAELGLSPNSRARMKLASPDDSAGDLEAALSESK